MVMFIKRVFKMVSIFFIFIAIATRAWGLDVQYEYEDYEQYRKQLEVEKYKKQFMDEFFEELFKITKMGIEIASSASEDLLEAMYHGVINNELRAGNLHIFFFNGIPRKIRNTTDYEYTAILHRIDLESLKKGMFNATFLVHLKAGSSEAVFTLSREGIEQILNISIIYDLNRRLQSKQHTISVNETVLWLKRYYDFVKPKNSKAWIVSMLLDLQAQEDFLNWVLKKSR